MLAIADIFEALTAQTDPTKKPSLSAKRMDIMHRMVLDNHIDRDCFELFVREKVYLQYARDFLIRRRSKRWMSGYTCHEKIPQFDALRDFRFGSLAMTYSGSQAVLAIALRRLRRPLPAPCGAWSVTWQPSAASGRGRESTRPHTQKGPPQWVTLFAY